MPAQASGYTSMEACVVDTNGVKAGCALGVVNAVSTGAGQLRWDLRISVDNGLCGWLEVRGVGTVSACGVGAYNAKSVWVSGSGFSTYPVTVCVQDASGSLNIKCESKSMTVFYSTNSPPTPDDASDGATSIAASSVTNTMATTEMAEIRMGP